MDFKKSSVPSSLVTSELPLEYLIKRQIIVEEIIRDVHCNTTLIRKINCKEVYVSEYQNTLQLLSLENARPINLGRNTCDVMVNSKSPNSSTYRSLNTETEKYKVSDRVQVTSFTDVYEETPMEVDSSTDATTDNDPVKYDTSELRKRRNQNITKDTIVTSTCDTYSALVPIRLSINKFSGFLLVFIGLLAVFSVCIYIAGDHFIYVNKKHQLENIRKELSENVLQQDDAVKIIIQNFEQMDLWTEKIKILPFVGTTGVGKTFTVNIIKKHFFPSLIHEVDNRHLRNIREQQNIIAKLKSCCCNLIIVDNLKAFNLNDLISFVESLPRSHNLLIIPIFNIHNAIDGITHEINKDDFKLIRNGFEKLGLHYELVLFDMLKISVIEKWLREELCKRQIDKKRHNSLVKFLLNNHHIKYKGFKGINSKLLLALDGN